MEKDSLKKDSGKDNIDDQIQTIVQILEQDHPFEERKAEALQYLRGQTKTKLAEQLLELAESMEIVSRQKRRFWEQGKQIKAAEGLILRKLREEDKTPFLKLKEQYPVFPSAMAERAYRTMVWKEYREGKALMCSIEKDGIYVGCCGINNLSAPKWEIAIELFREWTGQGIGYTAVKALVSEVKARLGVSEFLAKIRPQNLASQKLFEKLGAVPDRIEEYLPYREAAKAQCEEELGQVDGQLTEVAEKFQVEPGQLLNHILVYKLTI